MLGGDGRDQSGVAGLSRRRFVKLSMTGALTLAATPVFAHARAGGERALAFHHLHTGESLRTVYWDDGRYLPGALGQIRFLLRDFRNDEQHAIDPTLLDILYALQRKLETRKPFHVISGYRSPATNAALASKSKGVAKKSLHIQGRAIDVRIPGVTVDRLRLAAKALRRGGVGYYPKLEFVHLDTGRVRYW